MFGLGMPEILLILAIALIVIGPKKLPELAKTLGRAMGEFKKAAQDFKKTIDVENTVNTINHPAETLKATIKETVMPGEGDESNNDEKSNKNKNNSAKQNSDQKKRLIKNSPEISVTDDTTPPETDSTGNV